MRTVMAMALGALAACAPGPETPAASTPPPSEEPVMQAQPMTFDAMSKTAMAVTGNITLVSEPRATPDGPPRMKLTGDNGLTFFTELIPGAAEQSDMIDWKVLFGQEVVATANPAPGAPSVDLHAVIEENVPNAASNGGFCGDQPTNYIAMATGLESAGQKFMSIAAFGGNSWPPESQSALCGIYNYAPSAAQ